MQQNLHHSKKHSLVARGFTLMEMVMVMAIIAVLAGGAITMMKGFGTTAEVQRAGNDITAISNAVTQYKTLAGRYPTQEQGLEALVKKPSKPPVPKRYAPIMKDGLPKDPWGNDYMYKMPGSKDSATFEIISYGPDGKENTDDDLSSQDSSQ